MTATEHTVDPAIVASFNAAIEERGGPSKFSDFQLDIALSVAAMVRSMHSDMPPLERARIAEAVERMNELLPPVVPPPHLSRVPLINNGMTPQMAAHLYAEQLRDGPEGLGFWAMPVTEIEAVAEPAQTLPESHAPPPPVRPPDAPATQGTAAPQPAPAVSSARKSPQSGPQPYLATPDAPFKPRFEIAPHPDDLPSARPRTGQMDISGAVLARARERPNGRDLNSTGHASMAQLLQSRPPSAESPALTLPTARPNRWGGR